MILDEQTYNRWTSLKEDGDIKDLAEIIGTSTETIMRIFRKKEGNVRYIVQINDFYKKRQKEINDIKLPD